MFVLKSLIYSKSTFDSVSKTIFLKLTWTNFDPNIIIVNRKTTVIDPFGWCFVHLFV